MNLVVDHSYKLSQNGHKRHSIDGEIYFDIAAVAEKIDFNTPATNATEAFIALMLVHPTPRSIFEHIPAVLDDEPILGKHIRPSLTKDAYALLRDTHHTEVLLGGRHFNLHMNSMDLDLYCCATRLAQVLGYQSSFAEHKLDPNKVGVTSEVTTRMLNMTWNETIHIHEIEATYPGEEVFQEDIRDGVYEEHDPKISFIIYRWLDHVAYAISTEDFSLEPFEDASTKFTNRMNNLGMSELKRLFIERYPINSGRAGGKIFITSDNALEVAFDSLETRALAECLLTGDNDWENVAATALLLIPGLKLGGSNITSLLLSNRWVFDLPFSDYVKFCKHLHKLTRVNGTLPNHWFRYADKERERPWTNSIYGIDIIGGRSEKLGFDTKGEMLMRLSDPVKRAKLIITDQGLEFDYTSYDEYLDGMVARASEELITKDVRAETLENWYARRFFWGPSGGAPGTEVSWDYGPTLKKDRFRLNKRGALAAIPFKDVKEVFDNASKIAVQWSVEALKFESGKMRGILNTGMYPFIAQAYILTHFDSNVDTTSWFATAHGNTTRVAASLRRLSDLRNHTALMWDYADFNINHTLKMMLLMYTHIVRVMLLRLKYTIPTEILKTIKDDFIKTLRFVLNARNNTYLRDNESNITVRAIRSLQSGERGTSTTNSFFNRVDSNIVRETGKRLLGLDLLPYPSDKLGDDDFETTRNMRDAMVVCALFNLTGAAGQIYKILVEYPGRHGSHGEFLRLSYDSANNVIGGYPLRALMGFIHGEFFNDPLPQPFERTATVMEQAAKLTRRGFLLNKRLLKAWAKANATLVYTDKSGFKHRVTGDFKLAMTPSALGGIGVTYTKEASMVANNIALGINDPVRPITNKLVAVCIPSGEGKSTLANTYDMFIDHDTLIDSSVQLSLVEKAVMTGNWTPVNSYLRTCAQESAEVMNGRKVLLTWSKHTAPITSETYGIMLSRGTGLRANKSNRETLKRDFGKSLRVVKNYGEMTKFALDVYLEQVSQYAYEYDIFESTALKPSYKPPAVNVVSLLHKNKLHVKDFDTLRRHGISTQRSIYEEIGHSSLTGGYPKQALNESLAQYARAIHEWYKSGAWSTRYIAVKPIFSRFEISNIANSLVYNNLAVNLVGRQHTTQQAFRTNEVGYPDVQEIKHHYSGFTRLLKPLGASTQITVQTIVDNEIPVRYSGKLGRLYGLVKKESRFQTRSAENTKDLKDRDLLHEISLFIDAIAGKTAIDKSAHQYSGKRLQRADEELHIRLFKYIKGDMELMPPLNPGVSAELISLIRSAALAALEERPAVLSALLTAETLQALIAFRAYEHALLIATIKLLNVNYPGISLRD